MTTTDLRQDEPPRANPPAGAPAPARAMSLGDPDGETRFLGGLGSLVAGLLYLALASCLWIHVWTSNPASVTVCGCGDSASTLWYLEWPAYALSHGASLFHSTAIGHPKGINLLSNTSVLAVGTVLSPVTWLFGPIATLNVALTLSPVLSALAMFVVLRRWVSWVPAAFLGGLFYGFSPFVLSNLTEAHLMLAMAFVPPLMLGCLDELLIRQRRNPVLVGALLSVLVAVQFFIGTEVLLILAVVAAICVVALAEWAAWRHPQLFFARLRHGTIGLGAGGVGTIALLAYPVWYSQRGPAHLAGPIWPGGAPAGTGTVLKDLVVPNQHFTWSGISPTFNHTVGGYQGFLLSPQYLGIGVALVVVIGSIVWRRDRRLWMFGLVALVATMLSLGVQYGGPLPWRLVENVPLLRDILTQRFVMITYLALGVMLAIIVDRVHRTPGEARSPTPRAGAGRRGRPAKPWWQPHRVALATAVGLVAVVPVAAYVSRAIPFTTEPVAIPPWFRTVAPRLAPRDVLLVFPTTFDSPDNPKAWQAVDKMTYSMAEQGGPAGALQRAGSERRGQAILGVASTPDAAFQPTTADIAAVHKALHGWGVTTVVLPDEPHLPAYDKVPSVTAAAALVTAATATRPVLRAGAWVWSLSASTPTHYPSTDQFSHCVAGLHRDGPAAVDRATACVLNS